MLEKIISLFKSPISKQSENEALVTLATFFYKVDGRITLEEQDYIDDFLSVIDWESSIDVSVFQTNIIPKINQVLRGNPGEYLKFLAELMDQIESEDGKKRAKQIATAISDADGEISDLEIKCLDYIKTF